MATTPTPEQPRAEQDLPLASLAEHEAPPSLPAAGGSGLRAPTLARHLAIAVLVAVVIMIGSLVLGDYRDYELAQVAAFVVAVAGLTVLIGLSGQISIGNGAFMAVGGYAAALIFMHLHWPLLLIVLAATVAAALAGAVFGVAAARLRGPYLAGATLMLAVALPTLATQFQGVFGGDQGLGFADITVPGFLGVNFSLFRWQAWFTSAVALVVLVLLANLKRSRVGRNWRALRDDEVAASLAGLNVARLQVVAFVVSAGCAGAGGVLLAAVVGTASTSLFALGLSIQLLTAAVLGGLGSLTGAVWGSAILVLVPTYLQNVAISHGMTQTTSSSVPILAYGVVLIAVMLAFPSGIQGGLSRLWQIASRRSRPAPHPQEKGTP